MGRHVAQSPALLGHSLGAAGAPVVRAGYGAGQLLRGRRLVELAGVDREADVIISEAGAATDCVQ